MSATLHWAPRDNRRSFDDALRFALQKRYGGQWHGDMVLSESDLPYLEGLRDAEIGGAQDAIDAIETHDVIRIWLEF